MPWKVECRPVYMRVLLLSIQEVCVTIRAFWATSEPWCGKKRCCSLLCYLWDDSFDVFLCPALALALHLFAYQEIRISLSVQLKRSETQHKVQVQADRQGRESVHLVASFHSHGALHSKCYMHHISDGVQR